MITFAFYLAGALLIMVSGIIINRLTSGGQEKWFKRPLFVWLVVVIFGAAGTSTAQKAYDDAQKGKEQARPVAPPSTTLTTTITTVTTVTTVITTTIAPSSSQGLHSMDSRPSEPPVTPSEYLMNLKELNGFSINKGTKNIGKTAYTNSIEMACISWDGGSTIRYDVSQYGRLTAKLGLPSNVGDMSGAPCIVTISDAMTGKELCKHQLASTSQPIDLDLSLQDVAQIQINALLALPKVAKSVYVDFGSAHVS